MGQAWKLGLWRVFRPLFDLADQSSVVHSFAAKYVYSKELYADFFVLSVLLGLSSFAALGTVIEQSVGKLDVQGLRGKNKEKLQGKTKKS